METVRTCVEFTCFLCGFFAFSKLKPNYLKLIPLLLTLDICNELIIVPYTLQIHNINQNIGYNIFSFFEMSVWYYIFLHINRKSYLKKWILFLAFICFAYSYIEIIYLRGWRELHIDSLRLFNVSMIFFSCNYLYKILKEEYHELFVDALFWLSSACVIYHSMLFLNFTTMSENGYWVFKNADDVFYFLSDLGNIFYYLLLTIAFCSCIYYNQISTKTSSLK